MPTYEYKCKKCGSTFEKFQSIKEDPIKKCKKCGGEVHRLISKNGNFILKGSGYYSTDNRSSSYKSEKKKISKKPDNEIKKNTKDKKNKETSIK